MDDFKEKFGKKVYFEYNNSCRVGKVIGIIEDSELCYIIKDQNSTYKIPVHQSVTLI